MITHSVAMKLVSVKPLFPVDAIVPEILSFLQSHPNLMIEASPGAGKTTRVPPALLDVVGGHCP